MLQLVLITARRVCRRSAKGGVGGGRCQPSQPSLASLLPARRVPESRHAAQSAARRGQSRRSMWKSSSACSMLRPYVIDECVGWCPIICEALDELTLRLLWITAGFPTRTGGSGEPQAAAHPEIFCTRRTGDNEAGFQSAHS